MKIHALGDFLRRPLPLTPGNVSDIKEADLLVGEMVRVKRVIAGRGYDTNRLRATLRECGTIPSSPSAVTESDLSVRCAALQGPLAF